MYSTDICGELGMRLTTSHPRVSFSMGHSLRSMPKTLEKRREKLQGDSHAVDMPFTTTGRGLLESCAVLHRKKEPPSDPKGGWKLDQYGGGPHNRGKGGHVQTIRDMAPDCVGGQEDLGHLTPLEKKKNAGPSPGPAHTAL